MDSLAVGSIVRCREREWVVLPSSDDEILLLRPLTGTEDETCGISRRLANLGFDRPEPAGFPLPGPDDTSDAVGAELLWNAARLTLRDGAGPFRSLGRVSIRPRPYQFVPLLMALRLDPVRMLVADDVGIGKTIEALLIARELLDRGDIKRICILCPPYLCQQWKKELWEKFSIDAVIVRSGTIGQLEREIRQDESIFAHYQHIIVSIDYAKSEKHRANFLVHCPEFVIVDEAHGAAEPSAQASGQQQRHELLKRLAAGVDRHLLLLTATPHGGVEEPFLSLLGLLKPDFARLNLASLPEKDRDSLARHFVQRRRLDVQRWMGEETPFPERDPSEETYDLSGKYGELFKKVYSFSQELVKTGESLTGWKRRIRFWTALALLRCVMSSPAAAVAAFKNRNDGRPVDEADDESYAPYIYEPTDEETTDAQPSNIVEDSGRELIEDEARQLRRVAALALDLKGSDDDTKLVECCNIVRRLLVEGGKPIVWCRYIATSDYVAEELQRRLRREFPELKVLSVTGSYPEEDRTNRVTELAEAPKRVLVATDCLSEGINLQEWFNAVVHYDLPWNPNRLEQREGRVDRFGQNARVVKAVLFYGRNNPVDGAVLDVLLRKAKEIHRTLGITVPVPVGSETVMEAVLKALFTRATPLQPQLPLFDEPVVSDVQRRWEDAAQREKESRTRFAQRAINPEEVARELAESDAVLCNPQAVQSFVVNAADRFGLTVQARNGVFKISGLDHLPDMVRSAVPEKQTWKVTFSSPNPENVSYLGRNHPFVAGLSQFMLEEALIRGKDARAARCGMIRSNEVDRRTVLLLLRLRFMLEEQSKRPMLAEEVHVCGFRGFPPDRLEWLPDDQATSLLQSAHPAGNISPQERREVLEEVLGWWGDLLPGLEVIIGERAQRLEDAHRRVRKTASLTVRGVKAKPYLPPDLLGILVLTPVPPGVRQ